MADRGEERRIERAAKRLEELWAWRNAAESVVASWTLTAGDGRTWQVDPGDVWPIVETPVRFAAEGRVPEAWRGSPVELELWLGGEGLVTLSTGLTAGLDPFHHAFPIADAVAGGSRSGSRRRSCRRECSAA